MSEPFMGEIRIVAFTFAPKGWVMCNGQTLSVAQNQALFALFGTTYGGDGITTFGLPNLQSRVPIHRHTNGTFVQGQVGGEEAHTLLLNEMPAHSHAANAGNSAGNPINIPTGNFWGNLATSQQYRDATDTTMNPLAVGAAGGGQPHANLQPFLVLNYIVALQGIFPSRN